MFTSRKLQWIFWLRLINSVRRTAELTNGVCSVKNAQETDIYQQLDMKVTMECHRLLTRHTVLPMTLSFLPPSSTFMAVVLSAWQSRLVRHLSMFVPLNPREVMVGNRGNPGERSINCLVCDFTDTGYKLLKNLHLIGREQICQ